MNRLKLLLVLVGMCVAFCGMAQEISDSTKYLFSLPNSLGDYTKIYSFEREEKKARDIFNTKILTEVEVFQLNGGGLKYYIYFQMEKDALGIYLTEGDIDDIIKGIETLNSQLAQDLTSAIWVKNKYTSTSGLVVYYTARNNVSTWNISHLYPHISNFRLRPDFDLLEFFNSLKNRIAEAKAQMVQ